MVRYIKFKGSLQPKSLMMATDAKLAELRKVGYRQGKDYDVVTKKIALEKKKSGGAIRKKKKDPIKSKFQPDPNRRKDPIKSKFKGPKKPLKKLPSGRGILRKK